MTTDKCKVKNCGTILRRTNPYDVCSSCIERVIGQLLSKGSNPNGDLNKRARKILKILGMKNRRIKLCLDDNIINLAKKILGVRNRRIKPD